jgi:hypothetical protein
LTVFLESDAIDVSVIHEKDSNDLIAGVLNEVLKAASTSTISDALSGSGVSSSKGRRTFDSVILESPKPSEEKAERMNM